jgi:hypothetical protein
MDGTTTLGTRTLSGGTATLAIATLSVGTHRVTAYYSGDSSFMKSKSANLTQTVNAAASTATTVAAMVVPTPLAGPANQSAQASGTAAANSVEVIAQLYLNAPQPAWSIDLAAMVSSRKLREMLDLLFSNELQSGIFSA